MSGPEALQALMDGKRIAEELFAENTFLQLEEIEGFRDPVISITFNDGTKTQWTGNIIYLIKGNWSLVQ